MQKASKVNAYIPAQSKEMQINLPTFRMLGSDPIQQYETDTATNGQHVITLEPISPKGGMRDEWTDNFFHQMFDTPCLSFGYAQAGQENSFGWPHMASGLMYQHKKIEELRNSGKIRVETLTDSGRWYKRTYPHTPPSAIVADRDIDHPAQGATWFCSKYYRASLMWDSGDVRIRDIQLFNERRAEPFLNAVCPDNACTYDALPVMDGFRWRGNSVPKPGLRLVHHETGKAYVLKGSPVITERDEKTLIVDIDRQFLFIFEEHAFELHMRDDRQWDLVATWDDHANATFKGIHDDHLLFDYEDYHYHVAVSCGSAHIVMHGYRLACDSFGKIRFEMI